MLRQSGSAWPFQPGNAKQSLSAMACTWTRQGCQRARRSVCAEVPALFCCFFCPRTRLHNVFTLLAWKLEYGGKLRIASNWPMQWSPQFSDRPVSLESCTQMTQAPVLRACTNIDGLRLLRQCRTCVHLGTFNPSKHNVPDRNSASGNNVSLFGNNSLLRQRDF